MGRSARRKAIASLLVFYERSPSPIVWPQLGASESMSLQGALGALLLKGPSHGYEMLGTLQGELGPLWDVNPGQLYLTLGRMERDGLVTTATGPPKGRRPSRQMVSLTRRGFVEARAWLHGGPSEDLVVRVALARIVNPSGFGELVSDLVGSRAAALRSLRQARRTANGGFQAEVFDAEIGRVQSEIRWLASVKENAHNLIERPVARNRQRHRSQTA